LVARFARADVTVDDVKALCTRKGWKTGRTGCYEKGAVPANKGKRCPEGKGGRHPNARRTQFKKGHRPVNLREIGHEYVSTKDGYTYLCIAETNPYTGAPQRFVMKHRYLWEQANGPVPADHCLKSMDGNRQNCDPANWICIPRALLPRLSGRWSVAYDDAPAELKPVLLAAAKLQHAAREKRKAMQHA
jgi:hypothetical protein